MAASFCMYEFASPELRDLVRSAWSVSYPADEDAMPGIIAPDAHVEIVFQTGAPCALNLSGRAYEGSPRAMLFALRQGVLKLHARGANTIAALRLSPAVASIVVDHALTDLWNEPIDLRDIIGPEADALVERLAQTPQEAMGSVFENWLSSRLYNWDATARQNLNLQTALLWQLSKRPVATIADHAGVTARTLRRHCERYAGLSPKQIALSGRILRSCIALRDRRDLSLAAVADAAGFGDQPAFTNAFRHHVGMTPARFRAEPMVYCEGARS